MSAILWGFPPLLIHYFATYLDSHTQNFWRYFSAVVYLWIYGRWTGEPMVSRNRRAWVRTALAALIVVIYQSCFTLSLYHSLPALISLLIQLSLIVAIVLSCAFFADERRIARSPWFIAGACGALAGAIGMVVFSRQFTAAESQPAQWREMATAVLLVVGAAVFWGGYTVAVKWCLQTLPPYSTFAQVAIVATMGFFALSLTQGQPLAIFRMPAGWAVVLALSGMACIALAHVFFLRAIGRLGVGICNTVILASPIVASIGSWIFFHEQFTAAQIAAAGILLAGAAAAVRAGGRQGE